jgi:RimJ/RimL family protein N-acetyltransferase
MHIFLETERLILRRFTEDDVDNLVDLDSDPAVMRFMSGGPATPRQEIERDYIPAYLDYYQRYDGYGFWVAIEKLTGAFLGWFHFRPYEGAPVDQPELGYRLRRSAWGNGYATEGSQALIRKGFTELGVQRVVAFTYGEHSASRRVMEKAGMRLVRTFRLTPEQLESLGVTDPSLFDGDDVEYAITKAEWEQQEAAARESGP